MAKEVIKISTLIGAGSVCEGGFRCAGSARIDGIINGDVEIDGALILGTVGKINGNITAKSAQIGGEIVGDLIAPDRAELTATAKLIGDITTNVIIIDESAIFQGTVNMNQEIPERKSKGYTYKKALREGRKSAAFAVAEALKEISDEDSSEIKTENI